MSNFIQSEVSPRNDIAREEQAVNGVLRNTFMLLSLLVAFSAITCWYAMATNVQPLGIWWFLGGTIGLLFAVQFTKNSALGLVFAFAFTGFFGYTLGPTLNAVVAAGAGDAIFMALTLTTVMFLSLTAYALKSRVDMSNWSGMLLGGLLVIIAGGILNIFMQLPALHLALSVGSVLLFSIFVVYDVSRVVHGGERNYISAAIGIFLSLINLFMNLLQLIMAFTGDD